jgi:crossover junction endonuclease MUS81
MIKLLVDNRERAVIDHLDNIDFETCPLSVGDFQFWEDDVLLMVIERKTYTDLAASIKDGRYAEQKFRLEELRSDTGCSIVYFIEGKKPRKNSVVSGIPMSTLESALCTMFSNSQLITMENARECSLVLKCFLCIDEVSVLDHVVGEECEILEKIYKKLSKKKKNVSYVSASLQQSKSKKKSHMSYENIFVQQLCMIHQSVSLKIAEKLVEEYNSWAGLLEAYSMLSEEEEKKNMLRDLRVDNRRKVGPVASNKVYQFCHGLYEKTDVPLALNQYQQLEKESVCLI